MNRIAASLVFSAAACCLALAPARAMPVSSSLTADMTQVQDVAYHTGHHHATRHHATRHHATRHHMAGRHRHAHYRYVMRRHYAHGHWVWVRRPVMTYSYYDDEPAYYTTYRRHYPRFGVYGGYRGGYRNYGYRTYDRDRDYGTRSTYQTYSSGMRPSGGASVQMHMRNERAASPRMAQPAPMQQPRAQTQIHSRGNAGVGADVTGSVPQPQGRPAGAPGNSGNAPGHTGMAPGHMEKGR